MQRRLLADVALTEKISLLPFLYTRDSWGIRDLRKMLEKARYSKIVDARLSGTGLAKL
jgi:hypothetical protein